jgi:hypothetical protein
MKHTENMNHAHTPLPRHQSLSKRTTTQKPHIRQTQPPLARGHKGTKRFPQETKRLQALLKRVIYCKKFT